MRANSRAALFVLALALSACAPAQKDRVLRLDVASAAESGGAVLDGSLQILPFGARGLLSETRLAYLDWRAPGELLQHAAIRWDEPPSRTVERALAQHLRRAGPGLAVFDAESRAAADYWLSGRVDRFELVVAREGAEAAVAVNVTLMRTRDRSLVLTGAYCVSRPAPAGDPAASLPAFEAALQQIFLALTDDLRQRRPAAGRVGHGC